MTDLILDTNETIPNSFTGICSPKFAFRIVQSGLSDRTVTLPQGKCTIGSSQRCQIHLASSFVRPLHCLIVNRDNVTMATRWASGILLNGQEFNSAEIQIGDILSIGDVQLELVGSSDEISQEKSQPLFESQQDSEKVSENSLVSKQPNLPEINATSQVEECSSGNGDSNLKKYQEANSFARSRNRKMIKVIRALKAQLADFESQIGEARIQHEMALKECEKNTTQIHQLRTEIANRSSQSTEEIDRLVAELNQAFASTEQAQAVSTKLSAQLEELRSELTEAYQDREQLIKKQNEISADREKLRIDLGKLQTVMAESNQQSTEESDRLISELSEAFEKAEASEASRVKQESEFEAAKQELLSAHEECNSLQEEREKLSLQLTESLQGTEILQSEIKQLNAERMELIEIRSNLQLRDQEWQQQLLEKDQCLSQLENERDHLLKSVEIEQQRFVEAISLDEVHQEEHLKLKEKFDQLQIQYGDLEKKNQKLEETLTEQERKLGAKESECERFADVLEKFEKEAFEQSDARKRLEQELLEVRNECEILRGSAGESQLDLRELQARLDQCQQHIESVQAQYEDALEKNKALEDQEAEREIRNQSLESELSSLRSQCDESYENQASAQNHIEQLKSTLIERDQQVEQLKEELVQFSQKYQEIETRLSKTQADNEEIHSELGQLKHINEELDKQHLEEAELCQQYKMKLVEGQQSIELYEVDLQSLRAELSNSSKKATDLESKLAQAEEQVNSLQHDLQASKKMELAENDTIASLEQEKSSLKKDFFLQQERLDELTKEYSQLEIHYRQALEELSQTHRSLAEANDSLSNLTESQAIELESQVSEDMPRQAEEEDGCVQQQAEVVSEEASSDGSNTSHQDFFAAPAEDESKDDYQPTSFIDQFSNMLDESGETSSEEKETVSAPVNKLDSLEPNITDESDDAALEAYMANMMSRMRGGVSDEVDTPLHKNEDAAINQNPNPVAAVDELVQRVAPPTTVEREFASDPIDLDSLKSTSRKPVLPADINAMRELANTSARTAIARHHRNRYVEKAFGSFLVCFIAISAGMYVMLANREVLSPQFMGGAISAVIGSIGGAKLIRQLWDAYKANTQHVFVQPEEISIDHQPLPIDGPNNHEN